MVFGQILAGVVSFFKGIAPAIKEAWNAANIYEKVGMVFSAATVAVGVKGFLEMREMLSAGQSIMANKTAAGGKIPVIYGTRRVGTQIVYMDTFGNENRDLYVVYALAVGECEEILGKTIEIGGNSILDEKIFKKGGYVGSDKITSGAGSLCTADQNGDVNAGVGGGLGTDPTKRYQFVFNLHHGADSQTADPMLRASIPSQWSTNHQLNGICYIAAHFHYSKTGVFQGVPQITVQVKGKKVYDPRESGHTFGDPTTYEWSSNPALCYLDYITNDSYGKGLAESDINMTTFETAADVCDVEVDQPFYNGLYQSVTWSGTSGDDFIVISDNDDWFQNKTDEIFDLRDNGGTNVFTGAGITGVQRHQFYDDSQVNKLFINETLTSTYTNEAGSARAKVKRFHCNGYIDTNKNVMDNSKELLSNMRGIFTYIDGKYELQIEDTGSSTFSITEDHIIDRAGISVDYGNKDKKANKVVIEFYNSQLNYELDTATVLHDATPEYYSDDGEILEIKAQFPLITDAYIAYNMGKAILTRSRNQMSIRFLGTPEMYKLNVGDIVDITYAGLDLTTKICRVESLELQANGLVGVSLIEYFDVYTWEVPAEEDTRKLAKLPTKGAIHPPESTSIVFTDTDASAISRPTLTWTEPTDFDVKEFRVDVVDSSDNNVFSKIVDTPSVDLSFLPKASDYEASITSFNTLGVESEPVTKTFTIADDPVKTTEVEIDGVTLSTVEAYGTVSGKSGNWLKFLNKANFAEIVEYDNGFIVNGGTGQFENAAIFVDGATSRGELFIDDGHIRFDSNTPSDTTNKLYNVAGTLYWNGNSINTAAGDITAVVAGTNLNGGGTSGSVTLNLDSTISGDHTFSDNIIISGNLTVNGTTTTVDTDNLNVKDKNITLNYSTGDSSATANGAGITIQDAVSSTEDATILWNTTDDEFDFSHGVDVTGNITSSNTVTSQAINVASSGYGKIEIGGVSGAYIDLKRPNTDDYDLRLITTGTGGIIDTGSGELTLRRQGSTKIRTTSSGIDVTGDIGVTGTVDGRDIATDGTKLDGIEAGATTDQTQSEINALGITAIGLSGSPNITVGTISSGEMTTTAPQFKYVSNTDSNVGLLIRDETYISNEADITATRLATGSNLTLGLAGQAGINAYIGGVNKFSINSSGSVGIGETSPATDLHITNSSHTQLLLESGTTSQGILLFGDANDLNVGSLTYDHSDNSMRFETSDQERMRIDSSGNVGIGTSPADKLHVEGNIYLGASNRTIYTGGSGNLNFQTNTGNILFLRSNGGSESMRINSTGALLIGKTSENAAVAGTILNDTGDTYITAEGSQGRVLYLNRLTSDGTIIDLRKAGTAVGSIGTNSGQLFIGNEDGSTDTGLLFGESGTTARAIIPARADGSVVDGALDLGYSSGRFKDLYLSGTISSGAITSTGSSSFEEINFGDNEKAQFGASNDLQIYHNGSASYIDEVGTGGLIIKAGGTIQLNSPTNEKMIRMVVNDAVTLYHDNIAKLDTTSSGVDITGTIHATGDISTDSDLQVDNNAQIDGNCDIGTSSSNTLTINATIDNPLYIEDAKTSSTGHLLKLKDTSATDVMGTYISFAYDGSSGEIESGIIGSVEGAPNAPKFYVSNSGNVGLSFFGFTGVTAISPCNDDGSNRDNAIDLGTSSARFDDIYATNGTIQTSDRNEKQDIQELSDAEQRVAVACKGLIRRYKFNSAVEKKGDEARYHFGIIAQDLQDAFESEGLDAGDYGVFIQETWTDEEGNEQTRLGVRYNELLAFIIATL